MSKQRGRPFQPGNTFGKGRPKGSRNRQASPTKDLLEQFAPQLMGKCISMAMEGTVPAVKMCMDRFFPVPRDAAARVKLPKIKTAGDVATAAAKVTQSMGKGDLSPYQGETMMNVLEGQSRIIDSAVTETRIDELAKHVPGKNTTRSE